MFEVHPCCNMFVLFNNGIILHCLCLPHFLYPSIHQVMKWLDCFQYLAVMNNATLESHVKSLSEHIFSSLSGRYLGVELVGCIVSLC